MAMGSLASALELLSSIGIARVEQLIAGTAAQAHAALTDAGVTATLRGTDRIRFAVHATTTDHAVRAAARALGTV